MVRAPAPLRRARLWAVQAIRAKGKPGTRIGFAENIETDEDLKIISPLDFVGVVWIPVQSDASAPSDGSVLRDILADVPSQDFVDESLIPDAAPACFRAELIEYSRIDANRDQLARLVAERRPADAPHRLQLLCR